MMNSMRRILTYALVSAAFCFAQQTSDPWPAKSLIEPATLVTALKAGQPPIVISVAFPVLYHGRHIAHAVDAGPGSKPEGIEALKRAVAAYPRNADIVIYCGCCPMVKCPNIRPAYSTLIKLGFTHVRVLNIPTNMHTDWVANNYPSEGEKN